ncbi:hypothetical protein [Rhodovibrio salinarum]|uniref:Transposase, Mutator family n=1 Tax=Rhodovibrio salinarum TaxID=1087 RepID=A0A934QHI5_9PROT|nr:hypothetical protein [Rhodovibrio salinarum]MBK1696630.1 hypothetical protein [Rhodovibrio salinarum]
MSDTRFRPATTADPREAFKALARLLARDYARELIAQHLTDGAARPPANDAGPVDTAPYDPAGQRDGLASEYEIGSTDEA